MKRSLIRTCRFTLGFILLLGFLSRPAMSQTTFGAITGTVRDQGGALVPGVAIEAIHADSNYRYTTLSNETGNYTLPQLREGAYTLRATLTGFSEFTARDIQLAARAWTSCFRSAESPRRSKSRRGLR